ncbi:neutral zinc metallopeptidase [Kutzneria sp. CA-103260]|uniref:neutral zinc metallopeptidase n=1 Tax=Kutzneria sp. CA-103260 TaxID=2802641 RepID=UPI002013A276|nr:neutral zinc metallopeptidase [Kutzneria sp. CA-103260]
MPPPVMPPPQSNWQGLPPPRRPSRGPVIAIVLVAVVLVGVAAIGLSRLGHSRPAADAGGAPSATFTYDEPTTTPSPTRTTHRTTTPPPTTTSRRTSTTSAPPTSTQPAGPQPVLKLGDNPLFEVGGLPATTCKLARWSTDPAGAERFFRSALPCLDAAWAPVMKAANLPFFTPKLAFPPGTSFNTPCGNQTIGHIVAFYCGNDNTLYVPFAGLQTEMYGAHPGVYLALFAHEYGHHVQAMAGIMQAYGGARYAKDNGDSANDAGWELSRRLELQAQCFSGMFLAATSGRGDVDGNITHEAQTSQDRGDHNGPPRDHGTDDHAMGWWNSGFQRNSLSQCDTWLASSADVA